MAAQRDEQESRRITFTKSAVLMAATTLGAGIFALPYVFYEAGWLIAGLYLVGLTAVIIVSQEVYRETITKTEGKHSLLGLTRTYLGKAAYRAALLIVLGGLFFELVVYLILGRDFLTLVLPYSDKTLTLILFWIISSLPLFINVRRFAGAEFIGMLVMAAIMLIILAGAKLPDINSFSAVRPENFFLPFGVILFSLAGWIAVEPAYLLEKKRDIHNAHFSARALATGTWVTAFIYLLFVLIIFGSAPSITPDTISGLIGWPGGKLILLVFFGLVAVWTSYAPVGREIVAGFEEDLGWSPKAGLAAVVFLPLFLIYFGFNNFFSVVNFVGGVFLALEYLFILFVGFKVLHPRGAERVAMNLATIVFLFGVVYELYYFVVK